MSPKQKAEELFNKFLLETGNETFAKQCSLIAVDEISWILNEISHNSNIESEMYFYQEVKQELENL